MGPSALAREQQELSQLKLVLFVITAKNGCNMQLICGNSIHINKIILLRIVKLAFSHQHFSIFDLINTMAMQTEQIIYYTMFYCVYCLDESFDAWERQYIMFVVSVVLYGLLGYREEAAATLQLVPPRTGPASSTVGWKAVMPTSTPHTLAAQAISPNSRAWNSNLLVKFSLFN